MQQVATSRLDIAATGNQQAKAEQKQSGGSEFSQIFEQNQRTNNTSNASRDRQAAEQRDSNSHKTDTRPTTTSEAKRPDVNRRDNGTRASEAEEQRHTETKPVQSTQAEKSSGVDINGKQTMNEDGNKELRIHAANADEESGSQQDLSEQVSDHLSLESELQDLGDSEHTQWVNLLNQLLSKQGEEFDDGGPAADPFAVDVGQLIEGEPQKQRTKDLDEEIVITLPEQPEAETLEVNPQIASQVDLQTELTPEMLVSNELSSVSSVDPELAAELQELVSQLDENNLQQLEENELQQLIGDNAELKQLLADMLAQADNSTSDDAPVEISLQEIEVTPQSNEPDAEELSGLDSVLLASLLLIKGQGSDSPVLNTESADTLVTSTDTLVTNTESLDILEGGNVEFVAQLEQMLSSNREKLIVAENLLSRLQSNGGTDKATADFVASLQAGIKEFKEQLKAGHQPGLDLQALVSDAMASIDSQVATKVMQEQLSSALQQMSTVIQLSQGIEQADRDTLLSTMQSSLRSQSDVASSTLEANRQGQLLQSQVDKAINIAKPEAAQQLAKQVQVMVNQKNMVAEIRLDPPDLGSMKINISMQGDTASVNIVVQSQQARDMLEQNTPRLRELLEEQGIELGQSSVQEESAGDKEANETQFASNSGSGEGSEEELESEQAELNRHVNVARPDGIDYFA